jgi:hypothetical protein
VNLAVFQTRPRGEVVGVLGLLGDIAVFYGEEGGQWRKVVEPRRGHCIIEVAPVVDGDNKEHGDGEVLERLVQFRDQAGVPGEGGREGSGREGDRGKDEERERNERGLELESYTVLFKP